MPCCPKERTAARVPPYLGIVSKKGAIVFPRPDPLISS
jgi:hypothetical protein